jgi:transposase-like protein
MDQRLDRVRPVLDYDVEIRRVICSTHAIESLNARYRRAVRARGHFPNDQAALKALYLVTRSLRPHRQRQGTMGDEVDACPERIRHHLRRPDHSGRELIMRPDQIHRLSQ